MILNVCGKLLKVSRMVIDSLSKTCCRCKYQPLLNPVSLKCPYSSKTKLNSRLIFSQ